MDGHAAADGGKGVTGEVEVGDGVEDEGVAVVQIVCEILFAVAPDLRLPHAGHHLFHHVFGGHGPEVVQHHGGALFAPDARFGDILPDELILHLRVGQGFCHQIGEVDDFGTVFAQ